MAETNPTLATIYDGWEVYQGHLLTAVKPLTADQLNLRAAPELRTIYALLAHLIAVRVRWFHNAAGAGSPDIAPIGEWDRPNQPIKTTAELVTGLETSWRLIKDAVTTWTPDDLQVPFTVKWHGEDETLTRQWIVWHVIEHDLHHGGELSFSLGMHGLNGIDL
jgi:uncharacterized damage-inducible protein DinB